MKLIFYRYGRCSTAYTQKENTKTFEGLKYFQRQAANITCKKFRQFENNGSRYKDEFYILEIVIDVGVIGTSVVSPSEIYHSNSP
ncbi:MAG: hypothetical protein RSD37_14515 [Clostridium sp.]